MALSREELRQLAIEGAKSRLLVLENERKSLVQEFPELTGARGARKTAPTANAAPQKRRRNFSAAQRRAISRRMKAMWAERRKAKGKSA